MRKRIIALLLALCMCSSLFVVALAENIETDPDAEEAVVTLNAEAEEEETPVPEPEAAEPEDASDAEATDADAAEAAEEDAAAPEDEEAPAEEPAAEEPEEEVAAIATYSANEQSETEEIAADSAAEDDYGIMTLATFAGSGTQDDPWEIGATEADNVTAYLSEDGATLYIQGAGSMDNNGTGGTYWAWNSVKTNITAAVVGSGVTNIGAYCFFGCTALTKVTIPDSVVDIGNCAFGRCETLSSITIPGTVTSIGSSAFDRCYKLAEVKIPDGVTGISESAFTQCTSLKTVEIPNSVTGIGSTAFKGCSALESISLSQNLVELGSSAFQDCTSLTKVELPSGIKEVPKSTFNGCTSLTKVSIKDGGTITAVGNEAFRDCVSLEEVFDLSQVDDSGAGTYMFYNCSSLIGPVDLSSMTVVPQRAFYGCEGLTGVKFGNELTEINQYAFYNCKAITKLNFPETLTDIGNYAFYKCNRIVMELPDGLKTIGNYAFWNCWLNDSSMQTTTTVDAGAAVYSMNDDTTVTTSEDQTYTGNTLKIPDSVTSVGNDAFEYSYVDVFVVGSNLTEVDASAFAGYELQAVIFDNLKQSVTINNLSSLNGHLDSSDAGQGVSVVYRLGADAIYLDGVVGDDTCSGLTEETAVKTFAKAKALAVEKDISVICIENTVTVAGEEKWDGSVNKNGASYDLSVLLDCADSNMVLVNGEDAELTLSNIAIDGRNISSAASLVKVIDGGTLNIGDGTVIQKFLRSSSGNQYLYNDQGAVLVRNGSLCMAGGEIRDNSGSHFGGAVALIGEYDGETAVMEFTGGTISDSSAVEGGGIYLYGDAALNMAGGTVSGNTASRCGGGIFVGPDAVTEISAGYITNNKQTSTGSYGGGGIYVESSEGAKRPNGNPRNPGHLYLYNVEITDNYFSRHTSGNGVYLSTIACCETGNVEINITKGAVIHDNSEAQTIYVNRNSGSGSVSLPAIMLGGGAYNWVNSISGALIDLDNLFDNGSSVVNVTTYVSTKNGTVTGLNRCTTFITGNYAYDEGSAIGTNGDVTIGYNDGDAEIAIEKIWNEAESSDVCPNEIEVYVYATDGYGVTTCIGSVTLNEENDWKTTVTELPKYDSDGLEYTYTVQEASASGWMSEVVGGKTKTSTPDSGDYDTDKAKTAGYEFTITNTAVRDLTIGKTVEGTSDTSEYTFEITLNNVAEDGTTTAYEGDINVIYAMSSGEASADRTGVITFENGTATVTIQAGETVTLKIGYGMDWSVREITDDADSTLIYVDGDVVERLSDSSEAYAAVGTIHESTQVTFINSYRAYFPVDEEIVTDTDDIFNKDAWVKDEAVNEYNAIEIEMTTNLPVVTAYDLQNGSFTMNFHEVLDHELVLDEDTADFSVYIGGTEISTAYYRITFDDDTGDDCNFHVDVDLTKLYKGGVITDEDLLGDTEITIFFFADLEGTGLNGSYKSTIWYDIYDGEEWLYTSNVDVVEVYTYEIEIFKYDAETESALAGATFGIYYDADGTDPVYRNGEEYTTTSDEDGMAIFYGLADGTYYVKELTAPDGYELSEEVLVIALNAETTGDDYAYETAFANEPIVPTPDDESGDDGNTPEPEDEDKDENEEPAAGENDSNGKNGNSNGTTTTGTSPKTGDESASTFAIVMMVICASVAAVLMLTAGKKHGSAAQHGKREQ